MSKLVAAVRGICVLALLIMGLISFGFSYAPAPLMRSWYPLSYEDLILASSDAHHLDPCLVAAMIDTESSWVADATSSSGAQGLMQLMPETAADMVRWGLVSDDVDELDLTDPATNIEVGCAYLAYLIDYFHGSTDEAIAAYNAGLTNVDDWSQQETVLHNAITFPETQAYLIRVNNAWSRYRELYGLTFEDEASRA